MVFRAAARRSVVVLARALVIASVIVHVIVERGDVREVATGEIDVTGREATETETVERTDFVDLPGERITRRMMLIHC